jgi:GxxExxY protein
MHSIQHPLFRHIAVGEHFRWNNGMIEPEKKISDDAAERGRHEHGNCRNPRFTSAHRKMIACFFGNGTDLADVDEDRVNVVAGNFANVFCVFFGLLQVNFGQWRNTRKNKSSRIERGFENGFNIIHGKRENAPENTKKSFVALPLNAATRRRSEKIKNVRLQTFNTDCFQWCSIDLRIFKKDTIKYLIMEKHLTDKIMDAFFAVHRTLGPGLPESLYEEALTREFDEMEISYERQKRVVVDYKGKPLMKTFRLDLLVEGKVIIEVKAVSELLPLHHAQIIAYLKVAEKQLGYLVNFNVALVKNGIHRKVHRFQPSYI